jgi:tetratricopeptide (TPR) repeat protein
VSAESCKIWLKNAYGEIGIILYREERKPEEAEEWFKKAEKAGALFPVAALEYGMLQYFEKGDLESGLRYLFQSAEHGCELAYGDIGTILYLERSEIDDAEKWFKRAEKSDCLFAPAAYYYGELLVLEKGEWEQSLKYLRKASTEGYELAYGQLGSVLYLHRGQIDEAEECFKKAEKAGTLLAPYAHDYGMLLIEEKGDTERGNFYLDKAAQDGYPS